MPSNSALKNLLQLGKGFRKSNSNLAKTEEKQVEFGTKNYVISYNFLNFLERLNKKLEKNRESARNSRKRKKVYIELLENKARVSFLQKQNQSIFSSFSKGF